MTISDQPAIVTGTLYNVSLQYSKAGKPYCKFSIGETKRKKNQQTGKFELDKMVFYNCMSFGQEAEQIGQMPEKQTKIQAAIQYDQNEYTDQQGNKKRYDQFIVRKLLELEQKQQQQGSYQGGEYNQAPPPQQGQSNQTGGGFNNQGGQQFNQQQTPPQQQKPADDWDDDIPF